MDLDQPGELVQARTGPLHPIRAKSWKDRGLTLLLGGIGFALAWGLWHLYIDHMGHHQVVDLINTGRIEVKAPMPPQAPPPLPAAPPVEKGKS